MKINYTPEQCDHCHQSTTYLLPVDRGSLDILINIAHFIRGKGINCVHPRKEMEGEYLTSNQVGNLSRLRFNGLIARVKESKGNYAITTKGIDFLKGADIPKYAIVNKIDCRNEGYYEPGAYRVKVKDLLKEGDYWEGIDFDIKEGRVITNEKEIIKGKQVALC